MGIIVAARNLLIDRFSPLKHTQWPQQQQSSAANLADHISATANCWPWNVIGLINRTKGRALRTLLSIVLCSCLTCRSGAQSDSLVLKNKDVMAGEIKSMNNGVLTIGTAYSKNDFALKWSGVKSIYSKTNFLVTLQNGDRIDGSIRSGDSTNKVIITAITGETVETTLDSVVHLKGIETKFWSRTYASIDLGLNLTKANNQRQFSVRSSFGYRSNRFQADAYYNDLRSNRDSVAATKRTEAGLALKYFLPSDWYLAASVDFLSNTEQAIELRTTGKVGAGKFIIQTNKSYWGLGAGASLNSESFTNAKENRHSYEVFVGSELNLFDIGDLSVSNTIYAYRSLTETDRWRVDFSFDSKYNLPLHLYLSLGMTVNYDNRPAVEGKTTDYVIVFSIGWKFNK